MQLSDRKESKCKPLEVDLMAFLGAIQVFCRSQIKKKHKAGHDMGSTTCGTSEPIPGKGIPIECHAHQFDAKTVFV